MQLESKQKSDQITSLNRITNILSVLLECLTSIKISVGKIFKTKRGLSLWSQLFMKLDLEF